MPLPATLAPHVQFCLATPHPLPGAPLGVAPSHLAALSPKLPWKDLQPWAVPTAFT